MKKNLTQIAMGLGLCIALVACSKDEETIVVPVSAITVKDLAADTVTGLGVDGRPQSANTTTYYSLVDNKVIASSDAASTKWDIAFSSTKILINGGTSGPGIGGAFVYVGLFDALKTIPADSNFATDNGNAASFAIPLGSGRAWYTYDGLTTLVSPIAGRVLVIRTATGKFAKIEIISYYKGGVTLPASASVNDKLFKQRYYTFRYAYQPNGSKTF
ncbi:MAG: HmuY family protein [Sediminibacterium sp.]